MGGEVILYEVLGYLTEQDYNEFKFVTLRSYVSTRKEAMEFAKRVLGEYEVVKVQSNDREQITILREFEGIDNG